MLHATFNIDIIHEIRIGHLNLKQKQMLNKHQQTGLNEQNEMKWMSFELCMGHSAFRFVMHALCLQHQQKNKTEKKKQKKTHSTHTRAQYLKQKIQTSFFL